MLYILPVLLILLPLAHSQPELVSDENQQLRKLYGGLVIPQARLNTSYTTASDTICGGTAREKIHLLAASNIDTMFKWYIETPFPESSCLLRITENPDQNNNSAYVNLVPLGRNDVTKDGFFPCGRASGLESAYFDIPDDIDGDSCVLEWIWKGPDFLVRQCADISVIGPQDTACLGQCQNGGICSKGVCVCPVGYSGKHCESGRGGFLKFFKEFGGYLLIALVGILILMLVYMMLLWCARKRVTEEEKKQVYNTNKKYVEQIDDEIPNQPKGVDKPAQHVRQESQNEY